MKKFLVLCFAFVLLVPFVSYAASIGGAETQGKGKAAIGLDNEYIFGKDWKFKSATLLPANGTIKDIETEKGYYAGMKAAYGLLDNLDIYVRAGASDYRVKCQVFTGSTPGDKLNYDTDTDFTYGFGLKGAYALKNDWLAGCDLQYRRSKHEAKGKETAVSGAEDTTTYKSFVIQEWHVAPYIAKKLGDFVPYLGVRYSDAKLEIKNPVASWGELKAEADDNVGMFLGTDYKISEACSLNIEGRFIDERAVSAGINWKF
mgnify:FL=1